MKLILILLLFALANVETRRDFWTASDADTTCLIIESDASGSLMVNNVAVPFKFVNAISEGKCFGFVGNNVTNEIYIFFYPEPILGLQTEIEPWKLELVFTKYDSENYALENWILRTNNISQNFPLAGEYLKDYKESSSHLIFRSPILETFQSTLVELPFQKGNSVSLRDIKAMAFRHLKLEDFSKDLSFEGDVVPSDSFIADLVPSISSIAEVTPSDSSILSILAGCGLGVLVIVILAISLIVWLCVRNHRRID